MGCARGGFSNKLLAQMGASAGSETLGYVFYHFLGEVIRDW